MEFGNIMIFDIKCKTFSGYTIDYDKIGLPDVQEGQQDQVNDIKCHVTKMHRLLICYARTAIVVFSMNKNRRIQTINITKSLE